MNFPEILSELATVRRRPVCLSVRGSMQLQRETEVIFFACQNYRPVFRSYRGVMSNNYQSRNLSVCHQ